MKKRVVHGYVLRPSATVLAGDYRPDLKYKLMFNDREGVLLADLIDNHISDLMEFGEDSGISDHDLPLWLDLRNRFFKSAFPDC